MRKLLLLVLLYCAPTLAFDYVAAPALDRAHLQTAHVFALARAGERLLAAGARGLIIYSDDQGQSWQQARVPVSQALTALTFPTPDHGWAVGHGGVILHSGDGGESWQLQFDGESANQQWLDYSGETLDALQNALESAPADAIADLEYEVEEAEYAVEDAELAVTTGPADPFLGVWFADSQRGWAMGAYGMLYRTYNGGLQWQIAVAGIENIERFHYYSMAASEDGQLYLSGEAGLLYRSDDDGANWQRLSLDYDGSLFGVMALDAQTVLCYGLRGNIFRSDDSGDTWVLVAPSPNRALSLYGGTVLANGNVILVGAGGGMASSDDLGHSFSSDVHTSRSTFSAAAGVGRDLVLGGMSGLVRISAGRMQP
jgi:photosystem II stability/assembly factor-like uncharacterized protein